MDQNKSKANKKQVKTIDKNKRKFIKKHMAQHSQFNKTFKGKLSCGFPIIPFKTVIDGPGRQNYNNEQKDIIDEAFDFFRVNVLFKNYQIKGPADKITQNMYIVNTMINFRKDQSQAKKRLSDITGGKVPLPKQPGNFMSVMLQDGNGMDRDTYTNYIKHLRAQTVNRFLTKFYKDGVIDDDFKFWSGLSKKKFMGLNYMSMF